MKLCKQARDVPGDWKRNRLGYRPLWAGQMGEYCPLSKPIGLQICNILPAHASRNNNALHYLFVLPYTS